MAGVLKWMVSLIEALKKRQRRTVDPEERHPHFQRPFPTTLSYSLHLHELLLLPLIMESEDWGRNLKTRHIGHHRF